MIKKTVLAAASAALLLAAGQASATLIDFESLVVGTTLSTQYAGVTFSPNAFADPLPSPTGGWATNTDMTIVSASGNDVGGLGSAGTGQFALSTAVDGITSVVVVPGSFNDWVGVDNICYVAVGGSGSCAATGPASVSGNILRSFAGWLNEDGDASFRITFAAPISLFSVTFAGVFTAPDVSISAYNGTTLLSRVTGDAAAPVPEPSSYALLAAGLAGLAVLALKRRRRG